MTKNNTAEKHDAVAGEVVENLPAPQEQTRSLSAQASAGLSFGGVSFTKAKAITLPTMKQKSGEEVFFRIDAPIAYEEKTEEQLAKENKKYDPENPETIPVLTVTCLRTEEQFKYVGNAIFVRELERQYPEQGYVGRFFGVKKLEAREGKRYKDLQVIELIPETENGPARAEPKVDSTKR
jgi:hypothetical protein